jgi:predicted ATPase
MDTLAHLVGDGQMLVALDSCEHLLDACAALIDALLVACPALALLASAGSRSGWQAR